MEEMFIRNAIDTDYRADFLAASLVEAGVELDQVRLHRLGISRCGKNVDSVAQSFSRDELTDFVDIFVRKRDLYESLPEGLFHRSSPSVAKQGERSLIQSMGRSRQEAFNARRFFHPLEMAIDRMSVVAQLYERCLDNCGRHDEFVRMLAPHWSFIHSLSSREALVLVHFIAVIHRIMDAERIGRLLSLFLGCRVVVSRKSVTKTYRARSVWQLGRERLGLSTMAGAEVSLVVPLLVVRIVGLSPSRDDLFSTESQSYKQLMRVLGLFVPADAELEVRLELERRADMFWLADGGQGAKLGYTTIL